MNNAEQKNLVHEMADILDSFCRLVKVEERYNELILAVESKFPNETRHDTALRYIKDREFHVTGMVKSKAEKAL